MSVQTGVSSAAGGIIGAIVWLCLDSSRNGRASRAVGVSIPNRSRTDGAGVVGGPWFRGMLGSALCEEEDQSKSFLIFHPFSLLSSQPLSHTDKEREREKHASDGNLHHYQAVQRIPISHFPRLQRAGHQSNTPWPRPPFPGIRESIAVGEGEEE